MHEIVFVFIASVGLSMILVDGAIMKPVRDAVKRWNWTWVDKLLSCHQCSGWWSGLIISLLWYFSSFPYCGWFTFIIYAFAGSYVSMLGAVLLMYLNFGSLGGNDGSDGNQTGATE